MLALPNLRWSLDFVHNQLATGRRFRLLNIVDDVTRECLRAVAYTPISSRLVVRELADLVVERGWPGMIVSDNGTERPHSSLNYASPAGFAAKIEKQRPGRVETVVSGTLAHHNNRRSLVPAG